MPYFKLKDKAIINITSSDIPAGQFEVSQFTGVSGNDTAFHNNFRCKLNLPFQFSRNTKIVVEQLKMRANILSPTTDEFVLKKMRIYTPSISVKNQFTTKNRGDFDIDTILFSMSDNYETYVMLDANDVEQETTRSKGDVTYEYKVNDIEMNSLDLRSSDFTKNEIALMFDATYEHNNQTLTSGLMAGSDWFIRMIVYDYDEDTVNYASGEAEIKRNIHSVPNTGIDKLLTPQTVL